METQTSNATAALDLPPPTHAVWIISETEDGKTKWTEVMRLWPTRTGNGFSGKLKQHISVSGNRLVILPIKANKQGGAT